MNQQEFADTSRRYREELLRMYQSQSMTPPPRPEPPRPEPPRPEPPRPAPPRPEPPRPEPPRPEPPRPEPPRPEPPRPEPPRPVPPRPEPPRPEPPRPEPPRPAPPRPEPPRPAPPRPAPPRPEPPRPEPPRPAPPRPEPPMPPQPRAELEAAVVRDAEILSDTEPYMGTIRVRVTTAKGARPVSGATVVITKEDAAGVEELLSLQVTGQSGEITKVAVPSPPPSPDQRKPEAFHYDITVFAVGYYRETSKNVPVFPDIVSIQSFDLIPLPAGAEDTQVAGALTFYNTMPRD